MLINRSYWFAFCSVPTLFPLSSPSSIPIASQGASKLKPSTMHASRLLLPAIVASLASALPSSSLSSGAQWPLLKSENRNEEEFDLEPNAKYAFAGITTFSQLPAVECLAEDGPVDDILVVGFPFDTATSYRTGTRFGPNAIRQGSRAASLA